MIADDTDAAGTVDPLPAPAIGPLSLLAGCLLPVIGAIAIDSPSLGAGVIALQIVLFGWLVVDLRATALMLALGTLAAASITVSTYLYGGRDLAGSLGAACRVLAIVVPAALLTPRIEPSRLGDHLAQRLRLPTRAVVAATVALQRVDLVSEQWRQIQQARRARGLGADGSIARRLRNSAGAAFAILVVNMRTTSVLAIAMDARGFAGAHHRTWAEPAPWHPADSLVTVMALALAIVPWLVT